jgi:hypothetical protein
MPSAVSSDAQFTIANVAFELAPSTAALANNFPLSIVGNDTIGSIAGTGTLTVQNGAQLTIAPGSGPSVQNALSLLGTGALDITDNTFAINYGVGNPSPASTIGAYIASGYNDANFNGPGIISSIVASVNASLANPHAYAIGYADASDIAVQSQDFAPGTVVIKPVLVGDANMDGKVNFSDFQLLAAGFNGKNTSWDQGDFNYAGKTNFTDFQLLAANFNDSTSLDNAQFNSMNQIALSQGLTMTANADGVGFSFAPVGNSAQIAPIAKTPAAKRLKPAIAAVAAVAGSTFKPIGGGVWFSDTPIANPLLETDRNCLEMN